MWWRLSRISPSRSGKVNGAPVLLCHDLAQIGLPRKRELPCLQP
jgi:hypothetical protein